MFSIPFTNPILLVNYYWFYFVFMEKNTRADYIYHIQEWLRIGGTVSSYCAQHGLTKSRFYYYKKEILDVTDTNSQSNKFKSIAMSQSSTGSLFSIQYANGTVLHIHQMVDMAILKTLLHVVS